MARVLLQVVVIPSNNDKLANVTKQLKIEQSSKFIISGLAISVYSHHTVLVTPQGGPLSRRCNSSFALQGHVRFLPSCLPLLSLTLVALCKL